MSDIIKSWLGDVLSSVPTENIEEVKLWDDLRMQIHLQACSTVTCMPPHAQDFANGFLFGQLLNHYSLQPDFDKFEDRRAPECMVNNYTRLQVRPLRAYITAQYAAGICLHRLGLCIERRHTHTHTYTHAHTHTHTLCVHVHTHTHIRTHIHTHTLNTHTHTHIHKTHTHTNTNIPQVQF